MQDAKQQVRDKKRENRSRITYGYKLENMVRLITPVRERKGKLKGFEHQGLFKVTAVYKTGIVSIDSETFNKRINIRRLKRVRNENIV